MDITSSGHLWVPNKGESLTTQPKDIFSETEKISFPIADIPSVEKGVIKKKKEKKKETESLST